MTPLLKTTFILLVVFLTACSNDVSEESAEHSSKGGLPQSQRTQEDRPAGVKFNEKKTFKSLSDTAEP